MSELQRLMTEAGVEKLAPKIDRNAYGTPPYILDAVRSALGGCIQLDPASNAKAQDTVQAWNWCGFDHPEPGMRNGLFVPWDGLRVFINPPYGRRMVAPFVDKLEQDAPPAWAMLVNVSTSTKWAQRLFSISKGVCFLGARVAFLHPDTQKPCKGNEYDSAIFCGGDVNLEPLRKLGTVLKP